MKLEDVTAIQTVVTDLAVLIDVNQRCRLAEQRLAIAVDALKEIADYQCIKPPDETAKEALAQIEEKK